MLTVSSINRSEEHPAIAAVLEMPVNSAMVITYPDSNQIRNGGIEDVILRTGQDGWRHARQTDLGYMDAAATQRLVRQRVIRGLGFELIDDHR